MLPGSIFVLPSDSPLFSLAFVRIKEEASFYTAAVMLVGNVPMEADVH